MNRDQNSAPWIEITQGQRWEVASAELGTVFVAFEGERYVWGFEAQIWGHEDALDTAKLAAEAEADRRFRKRQEVRKSLR